MAVRVRTAVFCLGAATLVILGAVAWLLGAPGGTSFASASAPEAAVQATKAQPPARGAARSPPARAPRADMPFWRGVNLSGAEFGRIAANSRNFGTRGSAYGWPSHATIRYWVEDARANVLRIPFRWERIQPQLRQPLDPGELAEMERVVRIATSRGASVILDLHNFGNRWVGSEGRMEQGQVDGPSRRVSREDFADLWRRIASRFADNERVQFDLMNEPHGMRSLDGVDEPAQVARMYQAAIDAIRQVAPRNFIHIEPVPWARPAALAGSFGQAALGLRDPSGRLLFQVHLYLDRGNDGDDPSLQGDNVDFGVERLSVVTAWARQRNLRLFLGEFGLAGSNELQLEAVRRMIAHVHANRDVWAGWTAWGGGDRWRPHYHFTLGPGGGAATTLLRSLIAAEVRP